MLDVNDIRNTLKQYSTEEVTRVLSAVRGGRIGFDPRRDPRTAKKEALLTFTADAMATLCNTYTPTNTPTTFNTEADVMRYVDDVLRKSVDAEPIPVKATTPPLALTAPANNQAPAQKETPPMPTHTPTHADNNETARKIAELLATLTPAAAPIDEAKVREIAEQTARAIVEGVTLPLCIEIKTPGGIMHKIDGAHKRFPALLAACAARCNVWLYGPAGSGKTTAAEQAAKALGLKCYTTGAVDGKHEIVGYQDAMGRQVITAFKIAYRDGGIFLFDEADASHPAALLAINNALANGHYTFPGDVDPTPRHKDFICLVGANTRGNGADANYNARNRLDVSTRDRFIFIDWPADDAIEAAATTRADWLARVRAARAWINGRNIAGAIVTPRASINGARLLDAGMSLDDVDAATWGRDLTAEQIKECAKNLPALKKAA